MPLLVRKISKGKWDKAKSELENVDGDIIAELRTNRNTLSFWYVENEEHINEAILAIITAPQKRKTETIDIVWIDLQEFLDGKIEIDDSKDDSNKGDTVVKDLVYTHRNACDLTYSSLGVITKMILDAISNGRCKKIKQKEVKEILLKASTKDKRIDRNDCICDMERCPDKNQICQNAIKDCPNQFWKLLDELLKNIE